MARKPPVVDPEDVKRVLDHIWSTIPDQANLSDDAIIRIAEIVAFKDAAGTSSEFRDEFVKQVKASAEWRRFRDRNRTGSS